MSAEPGNPEPFGSRIADGSREVQTWSARHAYNLLSCETLFILLTIWDTWMIEPCPGRDETHCSFQVAVRGHVRAASVCGSELSALESAIDNKAALQLQRDEAVRQMVLAKVAYGMLSCIVTTLTIVKLEVLRIMTFKKL